MAMKQAVVLRGDIKMSCGKAAAQACHASVSAVLKSDSRTVRRWELAGQKKVMLKAKSAQELLEMKKKCGKMKLACALITDAGRTELAPGTITALGIGPEDEKKVDKVTGSLPLLR